MNVGSRDYPIRSCFSSAYNGGTADAKLIESSRSRSEIPSGALDQRSNYLADRRLHYKAPAQISGFFDRLLSGLSTLPGVRQTGAMSDLPMGSTSNVIISIEGQGRNTERVDTAFCRGNALEVLRVTLLRGRLLQPEDQIGTPHAVVISQALAKRVWPHGDPIGDVFDSV